MSMYRVMFIIVWAHSKHFIIEPQDMPCDNLIHAKHFDGFQLR